MTDALPGPGSTVTYASVAEVRVAFDALSDSDLDRLGLVAGNIVRRFPRLRRGGFGEEDLLQEAVVRALTGLRRWRRGTKFVKFLAFTMESIAKNETKATRKREREEEMIGLFTSDATLQMDIGFLRELHARSDWKQLELSFSDDPQAWRMVIGMSEGKEGEELRAHCGLEAGKNFDTVHRRVRRKLDKYIDTQKG